MASATYTVGRSHGLQKVLAFNSTAPLFDFQQLPRLAEPGTLPDSPGQLVGALEGDVKAAGRGGLEAPAGLFLQPYAEGPPGTAFSLNVWGYSEAGSENPQGSMLWVPFFLAQLSCVTGNIPGPLPSAYLTTDEYLCDQLAVTAGLGAATAPGLGYAAFAVVGLAGARKFLVEFAADPFATTTPAMPVPGMNALWRPL